MTPLNQLRTFIEVYRARSISRAAGSLHLTQPAVSAHIRTLEEQVGRALFQRHARGVEPTPTADELAAAVAPSLDGLDSTYSSLRARAEDVVGTIHLAGPTEFVSARLTEPVAQLHAAGLSVRLTLGGRDAVYQALKSRTADLAITASRPRDAELGYKKITDEVLVPIASPTWATRTLKGQPSLAAAAAHPVIAYNEALPLIARVLEGNDIERGSVSTAIIAPNLLIVRDLVEAGCGWSVLPDYLIETGLQKRRLRRLDARDRRVTNTLYLVWPKTALRQPRVVYARDKLLELLA